MMQRIYYQIHVIFLSIFRPSILFDKINQLDWYKGVLRQWIDDQTINATSDVLEVGCASGALSAYLAQSCGTVVGADYSSDMIKLAKSKHQNIEFLVANVLDLPFADGQFDIVLATSLINIVDDKDIAIQELMRCIKKGGKVIILVPLNGFDNKDLEALLSTLNIDGFSEAALSVWHKNAPKLNLSEISDAFSRAGLVDLQCKTYLNDLLISVAATKSF